MRYIVTAPESDFRGEVAGIAFFDGTAEVDESRIAALGYFRRRGYQVDAIGSAGEEPATDAPTEDADEEPAEIPMPRKSGSRSDWAAYAIAQGMPEDEANQLTRDQLVERFPASEGDLQ